MDDWSWQSTLEKHRETGQLVSLYCAPRRPTTNVQGMVDFVSTDDVLLRSVTGRGLYDGFVLRRLEDVYRVEYGGDYEQRVSYLFQRREHRHVPFLPPLDVSSNLTREALLAAQRHDLMVRIEILGKECRDAWVTSIEEEIVTLNVIEISGHPDGHAQIELDAITAINIDSTELQDIKLLNRWHELEPPA